MVLVLALALALLVLVVVAVVVLVIRFVFHAQDVAPRNFLNVAAASLHSTNTRSHIFVQPPPPPAGPRPSPVFESWLVRYHEVCRLLQTALDVRSCQLPA